MPHPEGMIKVEFRKSGENLKASVLLPKGLNGEFKWGGKVVPLGEGKQEIVL